MAARSRRSLFTCLLLVSGLAAVAAYAANRPRPRHETAQFAGRYIWQESKSWFGGFSGIEVSADGSAMTVLSDRARLVRADIQRDRDTIAKVQLRNSQQLRTSTGRSLLGRVMDSEGLAIAADGTLYISFEGVPRVAYHQADSARAQVLPRPDAFDAIPLNKALEALAVDAKGRLYTLPENAPNAAGDFPVWRWNGQRWSQPFTLPHRGGFLPVGADFGPDGRFYLLERSFMLIGFRSRLRRWDITAQGPQNEVTLFQSAIGAYDNLEGLSVWRDAANRLRATMISDDNFRSLQRTELVEFFLPE
ncbi:esterase-like activity of phytase family protein [Pseudophaeobacter flagellatus]|uniref:esterase-like activity of phytase family protein n=1 Tax=Pseudophaeobacter flagellatus TaxID=2899119 RepID=UPI001E5D21DE|nr:esterase-like activity of phytase family protein [Pseudophaeobacter flagellatus]MCD9147375.1 esterase-like activity of phytase family protein [Pseudophaeobacter flagellatus]